MCKSVNLLGILLFSTIFYISCSDSDLTSEASFSALINIEEGSYWVYEKGILNENGELENPKIDTVFYTGKVYEKNAEFYELEGSFTLDDKPYSYLYDSLNYLLEYPSGSVLFTTDTAYSQITDNDFISGEFKFTDMEETIAVPAGNFESYNCQGVFESKESDYKYGTLYSNTYFAENVGLVKINAQYYSSAIVVEKRLIDFGKI